MAVRHTAEEGEKRKAEKYSFPGVDHKKGAAREEEGTAGST